MYTRVKQSWHLHCGGKRDLGKEMAGLRGHDSTLLIQVVRDVLPTPICRDC